MVIHPVHPWIDSAHAPVYHLTYPSYDPNDPRALARYTAEHTSLYKMLILWTAVRARAFGFTVDMSHVRSSAMTRQHAVQYLEQARKRGSPHLACRAFITPNENVRGVLTAVFWQSPPDYPHAFFETAGEARKWALQHTLALDVREGRNLAEQKSATGKRR